MKFKLVLLDRLRSVAILMAFWASTLVLALVKSGKKVLGFYPRKVLETIRDRRRRDRSSLNWILDNPAQMVRGFTRMPRFAAVWTT